MSDKDPSTQGPVDSRRRRILQGAVGVPMVLTVSNAAGQAAASALQCRATPPSDVAVECIDNDAAMPSPISGFTHAGGDSGTALRDFDSTATAPNQACIAYIREDGSYYFASTSGATGGVPVTASCYTSFVP